jgi:glycosyltransferase involved in cell wall biosynthesis
MQSSSTRPSLSIICPFYNEENVLQLFYEELTAALAACSEVDYRLVFVDDGSTDATLEKLLQISELDDRVTVLSLSRNFGHQIALTAGLDHARADAIVMMDSDLQHPPSLIPEMLSLWRAGHDIVSAVRKYSRDTPIVKRFTSNLFYACINTLSETPIVAGAADFCLLSRRAHEALLQMPERHRFLRGMVAWTGYRRAYISYIAARRPAGKSKYTLKKMIGLGLDAALSFSAFPMRIAARLGLGLCCLGLFYLSYVIVRFVSLHDSTRGWSSMISVALILGGVQLLFIGLIGEYVARVFEEVKHRPLYLLKENLVIGLGETGEPSEVRGAQDEAFK